MNKKILPRNTVVTADDINWGKPHPRVARLRVGRGRLCVVPAPQGEHATLKSAICGWVGQTDTFSEHEQQLARRARQLWPGFAEA